MKPPGQRTRSVRSAHTFAAVRRLARPLVSSCIMFRPNLALLLCLAGGLAAQTPALTLAEGTLPSRLTVRTVPEANPLAAGLVVLGDAEFLPLEFTNRTWQQSLRADRARLVVRSGLVRVELPDHGRLLHYRLRGGERYGFLHVRRDGSAASVLELAGAGPTGRENPFTDRIGVAPDGRHAAILTGGGELFVVRLDGGNFASTGRPARPVAVPAAVVPLSLCVGRQQLVFQTVATRVLRCPLADGGVAVDVTPAGSPAAILKDLMAPSGDGSAVVFLFGPKLQQELYLLRESGAAQKLSPPASKYEEPGYLPEVGDGPRLLLNDDASRLLYVDGALRDELYLLDTGGTTPTVHVTSNTHFQPYIGTVILPVFHGIAVTVAIGDPDRFDYYAVTTGNPPVTLTKTGGNTVLPFVSGLLQPGQAFATQGAQALALEVSPNGARLRTLDPVAQTSTVLADAVRAPLELGAAWQGRADLLVPALTGDRLLDGNTGLDLLVAPPPLQLGSTVHAPGDAWRVFRVALPNGPAALVFRLPNGVLVPLPTEPVIHQVAVTATGSIWWNGSALRFASPIRFDTLPTTAPIRLLLSGAGA